MANGYTGFALPFAAALLGGPLQQPRQLKSRAGPRARRGRAVTLLLCERCAVRVARGQRSSQGPRGTKASASTRCGTSAMSKRVAWKPRAEEAERALAECRQQLKARPAMGNDVVDAELEIAREYLEGWCAGRRWPARALAFFLADGEVSGVVARMKAARVGG